MRMILFSLPILLSVTIARLEWKVSKSMKNELKIADQTRKDLIHSRSAYTSLQEGSMCDSKTSLEDLKNKINFGRNVNKVKQCSFNSSHMIQSNGSTWVRIETRWD